MRKRESILDQLSIAAEQNLKERDYWQRRLSGEWDKTGIPYDFKEPGSGEPGAGTGTVTFTITGDLYAGLIRLSNGSDHMLHMVLVAIWVVLLDKYNYNGNGDIIVGAPIYRQEDDSGDELINSVLPLRHGLTPGLTFKELLRQVRETIVQASDHYSYPMEILVEQLGLETAPEGGFPLFDVAILVESIHDKNYLKHIRTAITASFQVTGQCIAGNWEYDRALYRESTAASLSEHFMYLAAQALTDINREIRQLSLLDPAGKNRVLNELNDTARDYRIGPGDTVHRRFERQVQHTPDKIALEYAGKEITYSQLNQRANQLAHYLKSKGVKPGVITGIMMNPGIEMIVGILGILKAGAAYLPIDPTYPRKRVLKILNDGGATRLLTKDQLVDQLSITTFKQLRAGDITPFYTGARGQIKSFDGLPIPDRGLVNYEKYHRYIGIAMGKHTVSIQATRGCPFNCAYCHKLWPKTHVTRGAKNIFREIIRCREAGIRRIVFIDDVFNLDIKNAAALLEMIIKHDLGMQLFFPNGLRGDILNRDFIDLMIEAGTVNIDLALESASPRIQKLIGKNLNLEKFRDNVQYITQKYPGLLLEMELMLGFPTETEQEALQTLEFVKEQKWIHFPNLNLLKIYPNTEMFRLAVENGISAAAIHASTGLAYHELPETLPYDKAFVRREQTRFMNEYFLSKERLLHLLPHQIEKLTKDELVQKYDSYLPAEIKRFEDILELAGITKEELGATCFLEEEKVAAPDFSQKFKRGVTVKKKPGALKILLLDLSQFYSSLSRGMLYDMVEEPLGLMYLLTYLEETFPGQVEGKIAKSRVDFDNDEQLKELLLGFNPGLIGIRTLSFYKEFFHRTVSLLRQWGVEVPIIAGGPYATSDYQSMLRDPNIDLAVLGEGELTLGELVEKILENNKKLPGEEILKQLKGIAFVPGKDKDRLKQRNREIIFMDNILDTLDRFPVENPVHVNQSRDLLYLISTSGSAGEPKSVMIEHRNLMNLLHFEFSDQGVDFSRDILQFASIGFDVSAQEIFSALLSGGKLWLIDRDLKGDILQLFDFIRANNISIVFWPPAFLKLIFSESMYVNAFPRTITHIIAAGEQLIVPRALKEYIKAHRVYLLNHYGPSETHVVTSLTLGPTGEIPGRPSIGKPIANTAIYILDKSRGLQPVGIAGELCIGGNNVGRGYLNRPQLTNEKFDHDLWDYRDYHDEKYKQKNNEKLLRGVQGGGFLEKSPPGRRRQKIYKTGDLARWLPDGNIEFLGRIDHQVQIRGFRVELGEIEKQLTAIDYIKEAVVLERGTGPREDKNYLCAYVVAEIQVEAPELREVLAGSLPDYMIPTYFVQIESIPLTINGKLDRKALPDPETPLSTKTREIPANEIENRLTGIWAEVLGIEKDKISVTDNFFELGGHSLKATIMSAKLSKIFQVKMTLGEMFKHSTIRELAKIIAASVRERQIAPEPSEKKEYYPLSSAQQRVYLLHCMEETSIRYNLPVIRLLQGEIEKEKLAGIFHGLIQQHESLRTCFINIEDRVLQRVHDQVDFEVEYYQVEVENDQVEVKVEEKEQETEDRRQTTEDIPSTNLSSVLRHLSSEFIRPFDLTRAPLLRVGLVTLAHHQGVLMIDMHHIISDGISLGNIAKEFMVLAAEGQLQPLKIQYKDYCEMQERISGKTKQELEQHEQYWLKEFEQEIPVLDLPTDYPRPQLQSIAGRTLEFKLAGKETQQLKELALEQEVTLFMLLLAIFNVFLSKLSGREDIIVGTPTAGRPHEDLQPVLGMFVNTIPIRNYPRGKQPFREFLEETGMRTLAALDHQDYQFEVLVQKLNVKRDTSRNPVFDVMFSMQNFEIPGIKRPGLTLSPYEFENRTSKFDLSLNGKEEGRNLLFFLEYSTSLFKQETIQRYTGYFQRIITAVLENKEIKLSQIDILPEKEKNQLLFDFNDTDAGYPRDKTIHELFAEQVEQTPDQIAVVGPHQVKNRTYMTDKTYITYRQLNEQSHPLAHVLIERGVQPETIVGIKVERSLEMIIGILAILKAGGAYLPIDPDYPQARIDYMLKDSGAKILLTRQDIPGLFSPQALNLSEGHHLNFPVSQLPSFPASLPSNLVYIIYTSGTTGRPKAVMIGHRNVSRLVKNVNYLRAGQGDRLLLTGSLVFDITTFEIWWPLLNGMSLYLVDENVILDPGKLEEVLAANDITHLHLIPQLFNQLALENHKIFARPRCLLVGGDLVKPYYVNNIRNKYRGLTILHMYGPTENTTFSTFLTVDRDYENRIPIGKPVSNTKVYILNRYGQLQPLGAAGELCVGGDGVTRGYLNNPELTSQGFFTVPPGYNRSHMSYKSYITHASYLYRTGDLARWLLDGNIEFLGRMDHQVKIRGIRMELPEIETCLMKHPLIKEAVVIDRESPNSGEKYLCAYMVSEEAFDREELSGYLAKSLPGCMIPAYFVKMDKIPVTSTGKVDRKALPEPVLTAGEKYKAPVSPLEKKLTAIWSEVLNLDPKVIGMDSNFFELGGHSLNAIILISAIHREMEVKIPLAELFKGQTIRRLSGYIGQKEKVQYIGIQPVEKREYYPLSSAQKRIYFIRQMDLESTGYNMPVLLSPGKDIEKNKLETTIKKLIDRHESLRSSFVRVDDVPVQRVYDQVEFKMEYCCAEHKAQSAEREEERHALYAMRCAGTIKDFTRPFDLSGAPLLRVGLLTFPGEESLLLFDMHHIISDGTSLTVLVEDFLALYTGDDLPPLSIQYKDFTRWQNHLFARGLIKTQEDYWLGLYPDAGEIPRLELPGDFKRPGVFTFQGDYVEFVLEREDALKFKALGAGKGGTLYMNILACLNSLLYKYTGQTDIIIGSGIAGRPHVDLQSIIGMFVNTLAMRNHPRGEKSYESFLEEVIAHSIKAFENQDVQFEELVDRLEVERDPSRNPLFDISMVVQNVRKVGKTPKTGEDPGQSRLLPVVNGNIQPLEFHNPTSKFDMTFFAYEAEADIRFTIEYYTGKFKKETVHRFTTHFKQMVKAVILHPGVKLKHIEIMPEEEKQEVLYTFNETAWNYPRDKTIPRLFADQVRQTPDRIALVHENEELTYRELQARASQLTGYLYYERGVRPGKEEPVGILLSQPLYRGISLFGILGAGGVYVPLDPRLPQERLKYMINDAGIRTVISGKRHIHLLNRLQWESDNFSCYLCMDSSNILTEDEPEPGQLMDKELWRHVGESAGDDITGGGWVSSYTGQPLSRAEMDGYAANILEKLGPLLHKKMRVLEIGCATGISMYPMAPRVGLYYGTDLSEVIIQKNKKRVREQGLKNIKLATMAAHEIHQLEEKNFDLIIVNSVIQCFPGHNYLRKVIKKTIRLLADKGYLFIGDIMDQDKKEALTREMIHFKYDPANRDKGYITKTDFSSELFIARGYWKDLEVDYQEIVSVEMSDKIYTLENELTKFRYDVLITLDKPAGVAKSRQKQKYQQDITHLAVFGREPLPAAAALAPGNLAYIIYTSGTTGRPKGVEVEHRGAVNALAYRKQLYGMDPGFVCIQLFSYGFDGYVTAFFTPLVSGARLILLKDEEMGDIEKIREALVKTRVNHFIVVPSLYSALIETLTVEEASSLRVVTLAGERAQEKALEITRRKNKDLEIVNEYGVTESSVMSTAHRRQESADAIKIGTPIGNTRIYILDPGLRLQPIGISGELCISGMGLARGYLNNPELTNEKFDHDHDLWNYQEYQYKKKNKKEKVPAPHSPLYRSGDLARWLADGKIQYLGRIDHQVKLRGFRIEPEEIQNRLLNHGDIKDAVVIEKTAAAGDKCLCAYIVALRSQQGTRSEELRDYLSLTMPQYMIPTYFVQMEKLPRTTGGKLDRKALPEPQPVNDKPHRYIAPRDSLERKLAEIWAGLFSIEIDMIGIDGNFFQLGGHSLKATILVSKIHKEMHVKIPLAQVFNRQTIRELSSYIRQAVEIRHKDIVPVEKREYYALSSAQKRLYFLQRMESNGTAYNMPLILSLERDFQKSPVEAALKKLIHRHESLRTCFYLKDEEPVQRVHDQVEFEIEYFDLYRTQVEVKVKEKEQKTDDRRQWTDDRFQTTEEIPGTYLSSVIRHLSSEFIRPFDLSRAPLLRSGLIKLADGSYIWMVDIHHIVSDGTSHMILTEEFLSLYNKKQLEPLEIQYKDFSTWQNHINQGEEIKTQEDYWLELYRDAKEIPPLDMPTDNKRPGTFSFAGANYRFKLEEEDAREFKELGARDNATLYMKFLAVLDILFYKYTGQTDIVIGTGIAGRPHADLQRIIGMFINTLALRNQPFGDKTYESFLKEVKTNSIAAFENQDVQFEELVDRLDLVRDPSRNPLFDVTMVVQNFMRLGDGGMTPGKENRDSIRKLTPETESYENQTAKFDLTFFIHEQGDEIFIDIEYYTPIFKKETVGGLVSHFKQIIKTVVKSPAVKLKDIEIISRQEKRQLLEEMNDTTRGEWIDNDIHRLFVEQVERNPDHISLIGEIPGRGGSLGEVHLSYRELDKKSSVLARYFCHGKQLRPEEAVGIFMERSPLFLTALLGILKAGGAYVPLDPDYPGKRLEDIIHDAAIRIVISQKRLIRMLNRLQWACPTFRTFLCLDTGNVDSEIEIEKSGLMDEKLWEYIGESAVDDITAGGWLTGVTGQPFTPKEMDEYGNNVLEKLKPLLHPGMRVLEIGCASGLTMYRIAPLVGLYYGTDLSRVIIEKNKEKILKENHHNIKLACLPAHDIRQLEEKNFDLVIINSVIQSFHGHNYSRAVIRQVLDLMADKGLLFIGDVMDQDLKEHLVQYMTAFKRDNPDPGYTTKTDWSQELFLSRLFFEDLAVEIPCIHKVEFSNKIYTIENELTLFRYDVLLKIDKKQAVQQEGMKSKHKNREDAAALHPYIEETGKPGVLPGITSRHLAYVIYTSGSSGKPKGVMIDHRSVARLVKDTDYIDWKEGDRLLPTGAAVFDITTFEIWGPLLNGVPLVLVEKPVILNSQLFERVLHAQKVTHLHLIPQLFEQLVNQQPGIFSKLRYFLVGGDRVGPLHVNVIKRKYPGLKILHMYGPTENTTFSTFFPVDRQYKDRLPIGRPLTGSTVYILDQYRQLQPIGVYGELCTGGRGTARGYLNNPELTNQKFLRGGEKREAEKLGRWEDGKLRSELRIMSRPHPETNENQHKRFAQHIGSPRRGAPGRRRQRIYQTGDLARWNHDLQIEFLGRKDRQVKIRGYRIETGEIENRLLGYGHIKEAVVTAPTDESGDLYLCAYLVPAPGKHNRFDRSDLELHLASQLPGYMIPGRYVILEQMPLTASGKIDRKALPDPGIEISPGEYTGPRNAIEESLVRIWAGILGIRQEQIGIENNFFQLGGHSLKATIMAAKIHQEFQVKLPLAEIFRNPTITGIAAKIQEADQTKFLDIETVEKKEYYELSYNQKRLWIIQTRNPYSSSYHMPGWIALHHAVNVETLKKTLTRIFNRHESFRTGFKEVDSEPVQFIQPAVEIPLQVLDISTLKNEEKNQKTAEAIRQTVTQPFDLQTPPLFRSVLIKQDHETFLYVFNMHHIISDGWSMEIIKNEFSLLYEAKAKGSQLSLPPVRHRYKDFARWHNRHIQDRQVKQKALQYWKKVIQTGFPALKLPYYHGGKPGDSSGATYRSVVDEDIKKRVHQLAENNKTTLFTLLYALYNLLLAYLSGEKEIVGAVISAGRDHPALNNIVGYFINPVIIKVDVDIEADFETLLSRVNQNVLEAFLHQNYPFELVLEDMQIPYPDISTAFNLLNMEDISREMQLDSLQSTHLEEEHEVKFDMALQLREYKNGIEINWMYRKSLFPPGTIESIAGKYLQLLKEITEEQ